MRRFTSYGPVNNKLEYYAPREELIKRAYTLLTGEVPEEGGNYITAWGPRQTGKTWIMEQVLWSLQADGRFHVAKVNLEHLKLTNDVHMVTSRIVEAICMKLKVKDFKVNRLEDFYKLFKRDVLDKPLVLIMDEFDALPEEAINGIVSVFRNIYIERRDDLNPISEKEYLLHSVALIGVRRVLGVDNKTGSPFNVQRSLHIPNLTLEEVEGMFQWYEKETGQGVDKEVTDQLFYETQGQPGLTCWFGELLTEQFNKNKDKSIDMGIFKRVYAAATYSLPNNNILNIISKAKEEPYKGLVLELFKTDHKIVFKYDDSNINFLYMNGVIDEERGEEFISYVKFSGPFVQKRLFSHFSNELFHYTGKLYDPFEDMEAVITEEEINIRNLIIRYEIYLKKNRDWLLKDAPRRSDMKIYEAVYHFNLYMYLFNFLAHRKNSMVYPEFPTGNGKIDIIVSYRGKVYGIELKTYTDKANYKEALTQAAMYGNKLGLKVITLLFFVETIDDRNREILEKDYIDEETGVLVAPIFVQTYN